MAALEILPGDSLSLWVADRAAPPVGAPVIELQKGFAAMGIPLEVRTMAGLPPFEAILSKGEAAPKKTVPKPFVRQDPDAFEVDVSERSVRIRSLSRRGFSFSVWELMENLGWSWPTPEIAREPDPPPWTLPAGTATRDPALAHRVFFAEQIEIPPRLILWLSRHRFNTIFPGNPARFSDPERQLPDSSLAMAKALGFDLIVGGDCAAWFAEAAGLSPEKNWSDWTRADLDNLMETVFAMLQEMGDPIPRLSIWPTEGSEKTTAAFLRELSEKNPRLRFETSFRLAGELRGLGNTLFHVRDSTLSPLASETEIEEWAKSNLGAEDGVDRYLLCHLSDWDGRLGRTVAPLLWRRLRRRVRLACETGMAGAGIGLSSLESTSFLERSGFSLAIASRAMWSGAAWDPDSFAREIVQDQFDAAGKVVLGLAEDFERWVEQASAQSETLANGHGSSIRFASEVIPDENIRDKIDQRISEIEESAPFETCIELARALSTLVSLYDLEECTDKHEAKALARTIWRNNVMDRWPGWLQESSPLAERLRGFL
jgi:hypothetical protein